MFGKALGNGYAITAVIGKSSIMQAAQKTFISSTFWTERIGPTAALKTLEIMERESSWEIITKAGKVIKEKWAALAHKHGLEIDIGGIPALINFSIKSDKWVEYKTFITQEMLKHNILASNAIYVCTHHTPDIINLYFEHLDEIFFSLRKFEEGEDVYKYLSGPVSHTGFKRLN